MEPGLCGTCAHVKRTESKRGSVFYMCLLASEDVALRKYPPLPVRRCHGYQSRTASVDTHRGEGR